MMHLSDIRQGCDTEGSMLMSWYRETSSAVAGLAIAGAFAASLLGAAPSANATIFINTGNHPQPGEENILFGSFQSGMVFTGTTNQTNTGVQFNTTVNL